MTNGEKMEKNNAWKDFMSGLTILIKGILIFLLIAGIGFFGTIAYKGYEQRQQQRRYYRDGGILSARCVANMERLTSALNEYNKTHSTTIEQLCATHDLANNPPIKAKKYLNFYKVDPEKDCEYFLILSPNNKAIVTCSEHGALKLNK
jgi:hypothetical protein